MPLSKKTRLFLTGTCITVAILAVAGALYARHEYVKYRPRVVEAGLLFRSRQLPEKVLGQLNRYGIKTVLDLRGDADEEPAVRKREEEIVRSQGIDFVFLPMTTSQVVPTEAQLQRFLELLRGPGRPVLVHCREGKVRTGMLVASFRVLYDGWSPDKALGEMYSFSQKITPEGTKQQAEFLRGLESRRQELMQPVSEKAQAGGK